jgi:hypothetical protein
MDTKNNIPPVDPLQYQAWLDQPVGLAEAAGLRGVSIDTLKRDLRLKNRWVKLSARLRGLRRRDALLLP